MHMALLKSILIDAGSLHQKNLKKNNSHTIKCLLTELGWAGLENIWFSVRKSELGQNIFLSIPPTQSVSE